MATIKDKFIEIESQQNYVKNSLIVHSMDNKGTVIKWLVESNGVAERKKLFIELNPIESNIPLDDRIVINTIEIEPPG
jgi:hypothetical protein